ncbi:hypothetical protein PTT_06821 [Pyrenophora teres f. teres 0-1]|uniref:Uncharacterized protein n=2 Tax=Pyrenophora teres f. teres TaxID=97479 RepID=E3RGA7_PYRTT|nr:hypothetical protein PTT_06821 [Pyrenophora teres f. teres 0-1]KAE8828705.1 hypothetical protein PTNB85_07893 [Pyrenophora teres f. teres]CAA9964973.1 hypothetical protein PTMSG1_08332 [Pyrenophora teres f. maculata]KAE8829866.1 hypothetical protein HRS9139_06490 [Pyrenophora teres f. teres]KAE8859896.1 hypothetical protein PTNB29_07127 [Pyrenophora teres f. teres]
MHARLLNIIIMALPFIGTVSAAYANCRGAPDYLRGGTNCLADYKDCPQLCIAAKCSTQGGYTALRDYLGKCQCHCDPDSN